MQFIPQLKGYIDSSSEGSKPPYEQWKDIWDEEQKRSEHLKQKYTSLLTSQDVSLVPVPNRQN